jgi:hypothetical protein
MKMRMQINGYGLPIYAAAHGIVDFACVFLMFRVASLSTDWYLCVLLYNFCAFALQMPLGALALTLVMETGFYLLAGVRNKKDLLLVLLANTFTNPCVVWIYWVCALYAQINTSFMKVPLEMFAVLTEGYFYKRYGQGFKHPWLLSAAANGLSFGAGVLFNMMWR